MRLIIILILISSFQSFGQKYNLLKVDGHSVVKNLEVRRAIIEIGQSNAMSLLCNDLTNFASFSDVDIHNRFVNNQLEPMNPLQNTGGVLIGMMSVYNTVSIGTVYAAIEDNLTVIKIAVGSTSLHQQPNLDWNINSTGELYDQLLSDINSVKNSYLSNGIKIDITDVIWVQGEADADVNDITNSTMYYNNLSDLVGGINSTLSNIPNWHIARLSNNINATQFPFFNTVRTAQELFVSNNPFASIIDIDNCFFADGVHYDCSCIYNAADSLIDNVN